MKKEFVLVLIVGLFILAYVLDAVVPPLTLKLATPYHFFTPETMSLYIFTATSVVLKALGLFLTIVWLASLMEMSSLVKGAIILVISALSQLYALQDVATRSQTLPLEWSLSLTLAAVALLIPSVLYIFFGLVKGAHKKIVGEDEVHDVWEENDLTPGR